MIKGAAAVIIGIVICVATSAHADEPLTIIETRVDRIVKILGLSLIHI